MEFSLGRTRTSVVQSSQSRQSVNQSTESEQKYPSNKIQKMIPSFKIFGSIRTRSEAELTPGTPGQRPVYKRLSSNLKKSIPTSNASQLTGRGAESMPPPQNAEKLGTDKIDITALLNSPISEKFQLSSLSYLRHRKGQLLSKGIDNERDHNVSVSAISEFVGADGSPVRLHSKSRLKHVDVDWLARCAQGPLDNPIELSGQQNGDQAAESQPAIPIPITPIPVTPLKSDSELLNKRSISDVLPETPEREEGPKRKFFKTRVGRLPASYNLIRQLYKQTTPTKKEASAPLAKGKVPKEKVSKEKGPKGLPQLPSTSATAPVTDASDIYEEVMNSTSGGGRKGRKFKQPKLTKKEYLQKKVNSGTVNENFVRVDVSKKVFVRGRKYRMTGAKMKRLDWKANKAKASFESKIKLSKCRKCGDIGHFAKFCMQDQLSKGIEPDSEATDESPFPTLQEAARMIYNKPSGPSTNRISIYETEKVIPLVDIEADQDTTREQPTLVTHHKRPLFVRVKQEPSEQVDPHEVTTVNPFFLRRVDPFFDTDDSEEYRTKVLRDCLRKFGYEDFRPGQQEAIVRTLQGLSSLVILSTGSGKSLCYLLPAYLYSKASPGAITLCISPLVSLMEDQLAAMPAFIHGACLHTMMTEVQRENVLEKVRKKRLHILIVSPEAICSGLFGLLRDMENFPPVAFACIDEVHCVSEWSHNFRPSYLKLCKILRDKLSVRGILGLTATSTNRTCASICEQLHIDPSTVIRGEIIPPNLNLSVSRDHERDNALIFLLSEGRFKTCESIIVYCTRREECERIAALIRTNIQDIFSGVQKLNMRQRFSNSCEAYHAGMSGARRRLVQNNFMAGKIRIVVATVAFGMGIDKADIRAVIHFNMPKTFESYVQEIGRAGRDGLPAHCHLFLDSVKGKDLCELKRHVHANSVDRATVRKLIRKIFKPCKCAKIESLRTPKTELCEGEKANSSKSVCPGHEVSFSVADTSLGLDLADENIETLLCYLELDPSRKWIDVLPKCYQMCKIQSYGGAKLFKTAAQQCPAIAVAIALQTEKKKFKENDLHLEFNLVDVAASVGWSSSVVRRELKKLEWTGTEFDSNGNALRFRKSGLLVEFSDLAYRMIAAGNLCDEDCDRILNLLHGRNLEQEKTQLYQLHRVHQALLSVSTSSVQSTETEFAAEKCEKLKKFVYEYFHQNSSDVPAGWNSLMKKSDKEADIRRDTRNLLLSNQDTEFTGRAVARIFQGISSPCFPSQQWYKSRGYWRRYMDVDFHVLSHIASQEIISFQ